MKSIPLFKVACSEEAIALCSQTLRSGYVAQGPRVDELEAKLQKLLDTKNVVTLNSCTSALDLALWLIKDQYKLPDCTEVLCTPVTCAATNLTVLHNNMRIKWVDIDPNTLNMSLDDLEHKMTANTRIVCLVHWGGYPVDLDQLGEIKRNYEWRFGRELTVVEDAAHSFGSYYKHVPVGGYDPGNFVTFSFQAIKTLTAGDGGCLTTPDWAYKKSRLMRWFGLDRDNNMSFRHCQDIEVPGYKYHMNDVAASIALGNLDLALRNVATNRIICHTIHSNIKNPLIEKCATGHLKCESSCWLLTLKVDDNNRFINYMKEQGVECNPVHTRNDHFSVFAQFRDDSSVPNVNALENRRVCIPCGWWLEGKDIEKIIDACNGYS